MEKDFSENKPKADISSEPSHLDHGLGIENPQPTAEQFPVHFEDPEQSKLKTIKPGERLEILPPLAIEQKIRERLIGQEEAVEESAKVVAKIKSGVRPLGSGPIDSIFLAGPSGVGKTEAVLTIARMLMESYDQSIQFRDEEVLNNIIKIDGGEYQHGHEMARLIGSPPGYLGHKETPAVLAEWKLNEKAITFKDQRGNSRRLNIILVDEAEKASDQLHDLLLGVLDKGRVTLGDGSQTNLQDSVIFFTANVGNAEVEKKRTKSMGFVKPEVNAEREFTRAYTGMFKPEYRGRINRTVVFDHLNPEALNQIIDAQLKKVEEQFSRAGIYLKIDQITSQAKEWLIARGYNMSEGARALKKVMEKQILEPLILLSQTYDLSTELSTADIVIDVDETGENLSFSSKSVTEGERSKHKTAGS